MHKQAGTFLSLLCSASTSPISGWKALPLLTKHQPKISSMSKRFRADNPGGSSGESSSRGGANHQSSSSSSPAEHRNTLAVKRMSAAAKGPPPLPSKPSNSIHLAKPKPDKQGVEISARSPDVDGYQLTEESNRRRLPDDRRERVSVDSDSSESNTGESRM